MSEMAVDQLLQLLDERLELLTSVPVEQLLPHQVAAASLARCRALLGGIVLLRRNGEEDVAGVLIRSLFECMLHSRYVLLAGQKGLLDVGVRYSRNVRIINDRNELGFEEMLAQWEFGEGQEQIVEHIASEVTKLLRELGTEADFNAPYNMLYRGESSVSVHGLGPMIGYMNLLVDPWLTLVRPQIDGMRFDAEVVGAASTAFLAFYVFDAFGIGRDDVASCTTR